MAAMTDRHGDTTTIVAVTIIIIIIIIIILPDQHHAAPAFERCGGWPDCGEAPHYRGDACETLSVQ
jgi:hypothetical protein